MSKFHHFFIPLPKNDDDHDAKISCVASDIDGCNAHFKSWAQIWSLLFQKIIDMGDRKYFVVAQGHILKLETKSKILY